MIGRIKVAVIDDVETDILKASYLVRKAIPECEVDSYLNLRAFVAANKNYDLTIMDVMIGDTKAFSFSEIVLARTEFIVYASIVKEAITLAFGPKVLGYLVKTDPDSVNVDKLKDIYDKYFGSFINIPRTDIRVNARKIMYMISKGGNIYIHIEPDKVIEASRVTANSILDLKEYPYLHRVRRGMIVNLRYIRSISVNAVEMTDGMKIIPSRREYKQLFEAFKGQFI